MKNGSLPTVGFDRFIALSWADYALDLAMVRGDWEQLREWLSMHIEGKESARKTYNVLCNIWLRSYPETESIREDALELAETVPNQDRIILHWGMSIANFALFRSSVVTIGRLVRLQDQFRKSEISQRVLETYSNQGTIPRSVYRIIQSLEEWTVIKKVGRDSYTSQEVKPITDKKLIAWLLVAALSIDCEKHWSVDDVLRLPELFPFDLGSLGHVVLREDTLFKLHVEGMNRQYVSLS